MTYLSNILKTAAVAGLIGVGVAATASTPASARTFERCDAYGCHRVTCDWRGYCYNSGGAYNRSYYNRSYYAPAPYYGAGYYAPRGYGYRSARVCDRWGCHTVRRYEPSVSVGVRF